MALCQPIDQTVTVPLHDPQRTAASIREHLERIQREAPVGRQLLEFHQELAADLSAVADALEVLS